MAGEPTPAVWFSRFTTVAGIAGAGDPFFATVPMEVTPFQGGLVSVWRGKVTGTPANPKFNFQESSDGVKWFNCTGYTADADPGEGLEVQYAPVLKRKWFRVTVELGNATNSLTLWVAGFLESRES